MSRSGFCSCSSCAALPPWRLEGARHGIRAPRVRPTRGMTHRHGSESEPEGSEGDAQAMPNGPQSAS